MLIDAKQQLILPIELLEHILLYLDAISIVALATCARPLGVAICQSERLWRHLYWKHCGSEEPLPGLASSSSSSSSTSTTLPTLSMVTNESNTGGNLSRLPIAQWLAMLRLHAVTSSIWRRGITHTLPVALPQFNSTIHATTGSTTQSASKFSGELKLLDANKYGWSLVACTEPLSIMLLHNSQSTTTTSTSQFDNSMLQSTPSTQMYCLSFDPQLFNGLSRHHGNNTTLWTSVRYAPFHAINGRLHNGDYAVVTISAADALNTAGQWCSAIWVWRITDRQLYWYAESPDPYIITDLSNQSLLYQQSAQLTSINVANNYSSQYRQYNYANSVAVIRNNNTNNTSWTFTLCNLIKNDLDSRKSDRLTSTTIVAKGSTGCCHLHKLKALTMTLRQSIVVPIIDTVIYRHNYNPATQQLNWQLVRPVTNDDNPDQNTVELASDLKYWHLKSEGSLDRRADNNYQTASTQIDNDRVVLTGITRDQHQRLAPFVLLHSLSVDRSVYKNGELWYCTGPRYAAQSTVVSPNLRYLLLQSMESMIRVISLETGQVLRSLPGLPNERLPQPVTGDLWLIGATIHGGLTLIDTDKNQQYLHQLEEIPPLIVPALSVDNLTTEMDMLRFAEQETVMINQSSTRSRSGLERQRWSVGLIGYDLLICVRAKSISIVRFKQAPPTIHLPSSAATRHTHKKLKAKLASQARRATVSVFGSSNSGNNDHSSSVQSNAQSTEQQPLQRRTTLLRTMTRVISTLQQSIIQHTQTGV